MVKKLMKYELASYMRSLLPFQLILLGIALLHRLHIGPFFHPLPPYS